MTEAERYSDKRLKDDFVAHVLLSEPLQFHGSEVLSLLRTRYGSLAWTDSLGLDLPFDSASVGIVTFFPDAEGTAAGQPGPITLIGGGGRCDVDWPPVLQKSRLVFPEARDAVARHVSSLSIHVPSLDNSLPARFDAARRMTCIAAIFARLPSCIGIYFPSADLIVRPDSWIAAADTAMRAELPVLDWIAIVPVPVRAADGSIRVSVSSIGLAAFTGAEVIVPLVKDASSAAQLVAAAAAMLVQYGHEFKDSDTIGGEGDGQKMRIRLLKEGERGVQTDTWVILHPDSAVTEADFGPQTAAPPPPGVDNSRQGDPRSLFRRLFRGGPVRAQA